MFKKGDLVHWATDRSFLGIVNETVHEKGAAEQVSVIWFLGNGLPNLYYFSSVALFLAAKTEQ